MGRGRGDGKKRWDASQVVDLTRDGDSDGEEGVPLDSRTARGWRQRDQLRLTDPTGPADAELIESESNSSDEEHDEYALDEAYQDSTLAYAIELAMKDKDDILVERALDRIRDAQVMCQTKVKLSQRELDALERRRVQNEATNASRRDRTYRAKGKSTPSKLNVRWPPEPAYSAAASSASIPYTSTLQVPQSRPRTPSVQTLRMQPNMSPRTTGAYNLQDDMSSNTRPSSSSKAQSFQRPLPDDPQWTPSSRRSSNAMPVPPSTYASYLPSQMMTFDPRYPAPVGSTYAIPPTADVTYTPVYRPSSRESYTDRAAALSNVNLQPAPGINTPRRISSGSGTSSSDNGVQVSSPKAPVPATSRKTTGSPKSNGGSKTTGTPKKTVMSTRRRTRK